MSLGNGLGSGSREGGSVVFFLWKVREEGKGMDRVGGGGVGTGKGTGKSMRTRLSKLPFRQSTL